MFPAAPDVIDCLPTMDELDSASSVEELSKAIDSLASGKAPGNNGIPFESSQTVLDYHTATTSRSHLPVLVRRSCTTAHEGLQNNYPIQEQGREERL